MPFTFSHPAIVLPLTCLPKKYFSLTGLVIGSITPDFEYFLRMQIKSNYSHTIEGLFWFNLPIGLLLAYVFHIVVRDSLIDNLPSSMQSRFSVFKQFDWNRQFKTKWQVILNSILIGAASHLLWDNFTHSGGYFVRKISVLSNAIDIFGSQIPIFRILQHLSTLLGGLIILYVIYKLPAEKNADSTMELKYWGILTGLTLLIISLRFLSGLETDQYGNIIVSTISAMLLGLAFTPLILRKIKKNQR